MFSPEAERALYNIIVDRLLYHFRRYQRNVLKLRKEDTLKKLQYLAERGLMDG